MSKVTDIVKNELWSSNALITLVKKTIEYGALATAFWALGEPAADKYVNSHIEAHEHRVEEADANKVPFRKLLSQEIGVPSDRIHIVFGSMYKGLSETMADIDTFRVSYIPMLEHEASVITPRLEVREDGAFWIDNDNREYRVEYNNDNIGYYFKGGKWVQIFR